jgi:hypothetical protein
VNIIVKSKMVLVDAKTSIPMFTGNVRSNSDNKPPSIVQHPIIHPPQKKPTATLLPKPPQIPSAQHVIQKQPAKKRKEGGFIPLGPGSTILHPQSMPTPNVPGVRVTIATSTTPTLSGPPGSGFLPPFRLPSTTITTNAGGSVKEEAEDHTFEGLPNIMDLETSSYLNV